MTEGQLWLLVNAVLPPPAVHLGHGVPRQGGEGGDRAACGEADMESRGQAHLGL